MVQQSCSIAYYIIIYWFLTFNSVILELMLVIDGSFNRNTRSVPFCIFSCRTLNNIYKLLVIIITCYEKQMNWPHKRHYFKMSRYFYLKLYHLFSEMQEKLETSRIQIWWILEDHLAIPIYYHHQCFLFLSRTDREELSLSIQSDVVFSSPAYHEHLQTF